MERRAAIFGSASLAAAGLGWRRTGNKVCELGQALPGLSVRSGRDGLAGHNAEADQRDEALGLVVDADIIGVGQRIGVGRVHTAGTDDIAEPSQTCKRSSSSRKCRVHQQPR